MIAFGRHAAGSEAIDSPQPAWVGCGEGRIGAEKGGVEKIHLIDLTSRCSCGILLLDDAGDPKILQKF